MSTSPRDTQFLGFAKALLAEMLEQRANGYICGYIDFAEDDTDEIEEYGLVIARRAYDLMLHGAFSSSLFDPRMVVTMEQCKKRIELVPDLTEFPKEPDA